MINNINAAQLAADAAQLAANAAQLAANAVQLAANATPPAPPAAPPAPPAAPPAPPAAPPAPPAAPPAPPAAPPAATGAGFNYGGAIVQKNLEYLKKSIVENKWPHYLLRRLPIMGVILLAINGSILLFSYLTVPKDDSFGLDSLVWLTALEKNCLFLFLFFCLFVLPMLAITKLTYGKSKSKTELTTTSSTNNDDHQRMTMSIIALALSWLPLILLIIDIRCFVIFAFIWGIILCVVSWQVNRTFGYTRAWARGTYYERLLKLLDEQIKECALDTKTAGDKRFELLERWSKEMYLDTVGDTFYFLERLTKEK